MSAQSTTLTTAVAHSIQLLQVVTPMQSRPLVIISTRLPPQICGIGTFSWLLHQHWTGEKSRHRFLVVRDRDNVDLISAAKISEFGDDWAVLAQALNDQGSDDVLLHYAGRAYH